jgi:hypothetical protein
MENMLRKKERAGRPQSQLKLESCGLRLASGLQRFHALRQSLVINLLRHGRKGWRWSAPAQLFYFIE